MRREILLRLSQSQRNKCGLFATILNYFVPSGSVRLPATGILLVIFAIARGPVAPIVVVVIEEAPSETAPQSRTKTTLARRSRLSRVNTRLTTVGVA